MAASDSEIVITTSMGKMQTITADKKASYLQFLQYFINKIENLFKWKLKKITLNYRLLFADQWGTE